MTPAPLVVEAPLPLDTVADIDEGLRLLRRLRREGDLGERVLAQAAIDDLLDLRNELTAICPDCKRLISLHELYRDGRCPVVVFAPS